MSSKGASAGTGGNDQVGNLLPKLRFPEFKDAPAWQEVTLKNVLRPAVREIAKPGSSYTGLGLRSHGKGTFQKSGQDPEKNSMDILYVVHRNDLILNITFAWEGAIAIANDSDHGCYVSHRFPTYEFKSGISSPDFFRYIITGNAFVYRLGVISPGGAGRNRVMNKNDFLSILTLLPAVSEQQKIAECLSSIDKLITAEAGKLDALKDHKKSLMQQLFPTPGETTPRLRFPEFKGAGDWEWRTINEIADLFKGKNISKSDIVIDGYQSCIRYGELYTSYGEVIDEVISKTNLPLSELFMSKKNDVIIPASGETKIDIATASCVMLDNVALGSDLNVIRSRQNGIFLSYFLNGPLKYEIAKVAQGDSVVHLYPTQIGLLRVAISTAREQQKIAECLFSLDGLITAQGDYIECLKVHKRGLMQQLFPAADEVRL